MWSVPTIHTENLQAELHKALSRTVVAYACPAWEFAADIHLLKLHLLQNMVLRTTGTFPRCTPVRELHMAFQVPLFVIT
jgi:hypothetical protein